MLKEFDAFGDSCLSMKRRHDKMRRPTKAAGLLLGLLFLVACTAGNAGYSSAEYDRSLAARLFTAGYQDIASVYIEEVSPRQLAAAGLSELHELDERLEFHRTDEGSLELLLNQQPARSYRLPRRDEDYSAWGRLTAEALDDARGLSPSLAAAESEALYSTVFRGIVGELDRYSRYAGQDIAKENRASRTGFGGIGVRINAEEEGVRILSVMEDTPAERAGLQDNDLILAVDGESAANLDQLEVVRRLRGPVNSSVTLQIRRNEVGEPFAITVQRAHIVPQTVSHYVEDGVAIFRISGFNHASTSVLRQKLSEVEQQLGDELSGYILDLRSNPGGLLDQAVGVADLFLENGRIVSTHGRHPDSHQYFESRRDPWIPHRPMVVLVNGNSASASEIVAAALQDADRALVVGSSSFGKGTVQTVLRLPNEGELTLTWARFHAPSGYSLDQRGVMPDICTSLPEAEEEELLLQIRRGENRIYRELRQLQIDVDNETALADFRSHCPSDNRESDRELRIALKLLQDNSLYMAALGRPTITAEVPQLPSDEPSLETITAEGVTAPQ